MVLSLFANIVLNAVIKQILVLINTLQIVLHSPMMKIAFPANALNAYSILMPIA